MSLSSPISGNSFPSPVLTVSQCIEKPLQNKPFDDAQTLLQQANEKARVELGSRGVTKTSKSSCFYGLAGGIAASLLLENPLPSILGMGECFPRAHAQQKVGGEFQVNTYTNNSQRLPSVASFSNGSFIVTWESDGQDGSRLGVYGQLFAGNGSKIGSEFQVNTYTNNSQMNPSVASFSNGNFIVTWQSDGQDGSDHGVYGQLFNGNGSKIGSEFQVNTYTNRYQNYPSVASFSNGYFIVAWHSFLQDGSDYGVYGQLFAGNGSKNGNELQVNAFTPDWQSSPSVASFSNGYFVVAWHSFLQDGSGDGIYGQLFDGNGTKIGSEFRANNYTTSNQQNPSVASFNNGNFVVTWHSYLQDGSGGGIYGQLFDGNGTKIGSEFQVNTYTTNNQWFSSAASFSGGNFVVTWNSYLQDNSNYGVYGQLFAGNGSKIGSEFQVNTYTNNDQAYPSVVSLSNSNFVVTWLSIGQDGSSDGIYGQIFNDFPTTPNSRTTFSATSDLKNSFSWIWFLLGGVGAVSFLALMGYFIFRSKHRKQDNDMRVYELGEQTDDSTAETQYQRTPNFVKAGTETQYQRTPNFVTERAGQEPHYQHTPDFVKAGAEKGTPYAHTPDFVTVEAGGV